MGDTNGYDSDSADSCDNRVETKTPAVLSAKDRREKHNTLVTRQEEDRTAERVRVFKQAINHWINYYPNGRLPSDANVCYHSTGRIVYLTDSVPTAVVSEMMLVCRDLGYKIYSEPGKIHIYDPEMNDIPPTDTFPSWMDITAIAIVFIGVVITFIS